MKKIAIFVAALSILGSAAYAGPKTAKKPAKATSKVTDVWKCPMTGEVVKDHSDKGVVVGKYKAHFCCASCPDKFAKLSKKAQTAKLASLAKKDAPKKKG